MRAVTVAIAVALLVASATADFCNINATATTKVNLNTVQTYTGTAAGYRIDVSPCTAKNMTECDNKMAFGTVSKGNTVSCFMTAPTVTFDTATNTTKLAFSSELRSTLALLMNGSAVRRLTTKYVCDKAATTVVEDGAVYKSVTRELVVTFKTASACPFVPTAAPTQMPTTTAAPLPHGGDDDDKKLSTWAIVGIIAGCVVAVVVVAFVCFKCRSGESQAEGEYARV